MDVIGRGRGKPLLCPPLHNRKLIKGRGGGYARPRLMKWTGFGGGCALRFEQRKQQEKKWTSSAEAADAFASSFLPRR